MSEIVDFPVDQTKCPFCGQDNNCASEIAKQTGEPEKPCWCLNETFSEELLATIPEPAKDKACICIDCCKNDTDKNKRTDENWSDLLFFI